MSKKNVKPGDKIKIKIGGREIETIIDPHGIQRLPSNPIYKGLWDSGSLDLNKLAIGYHEGKISKEDYLEFWLHFGMSVCSFSEKHDFEDLEIENPLW